MAGLDPAIHAVTARRDADSLAPTVQSPSQRNRVDHRIKSGDDEVETKYNELDTRGLDPAIHAVQPKTTEAVETQAFQNQPVPPYAGRKH